MDILNNQVTISLNTPMLVAIGIVVVLLITAVIFLSVRLRKVTSVQPKYGFLGKSLYPIVTLAVIATGIFFTGLAVNNNTVFNLKAQKQVEADIITNVLSHSSTQTFVDLKLVPTVDNKIWGAETDKFDIYWNLSGPSKYSFVELGKNNSDRSGVQSYVDPGNYHITVTVLYQDSSYTFSKDVVF